MSTTYTCDWCGEQIVPPYGCAEMHLLGNFYDGRRTASRVSPRHFHAGSAHDEDSCLRQALALLDGHCGERPKSQREIHDEAENVWKQLPRERRESLVFQALGDERLIIRELTACMNAELGFPQPESGRVPRALRESEVAHLAKRLLRDGQLQREPEMFNKTRTRYRYFRKRALDGPIVELERAYRDQGEREQA